MTDPNNCTFNRTGADNRTFWVTLTQDGDGWNYDSANWDNDENSNREWASGSVQLRSSLNGWEDVNIALTKYSYGANYSFQYKGLVVPENVEYTFKFVHVDGDNVAWYGGSDVSLTDAAPYGKMAYEGGENMKFKLTPGTYDIYLDVAGLNFMFVKQPNP